MGKLLEPQLDLLTAPQKTYRYGTHIAQRANWTDRSIRLDRRLEIRCDVSGLHTRESSPAELQRYRHARAERAPPVAIAAAAPATSATKRN